MSLFFFSFFYKLPFLKSVDRLSSIKMYTSPRLFLRFLDLLYLLRGLLDQAKKKKNHYFGHEFLNTSTSLAGQDMK